MLTSTSALVHVASMSPRRKTWGNPNTPQRTGSPALINDAPERDKRRRRDRPGRTSIFRNKQTHQLVEAMCHGIFPTVNLCSEGSCSEIGMVAHDREGSCSDEQCPVKTDFLVVADWIIGRVLWRSRGMTRSCLWWVDDNNDVCSVNHRVARQTPYSPYILGGIRVTRCRVGLHVSEATRNPNKIFYIWSRSVYI